MEWFEIVIAIPIMVIGAYIRGKIYEWKRNIYYKESWREREK